MSAMRHIRRRVALSPLTQSKSGAPFGQHFLVDRQIQQRIIDAIDLSADSVVLEIGAGPGNMTRLLAERVNKLISVEIDQSLAANLQQTFAGNDQVEIIHDDFLNLSIPALALHASDHKLIVF